MEELARAAAAAGGRLLVVGGFVRDRLLGREPAPELDLELHGLAPSAVRDLLAGFGRPTRTGRAFPVWRVRGLPLEVHLAAPPDAGFAEAARRRDLSVNALGWDPLTGELLDPHGGLRDLERRVLRATDPARFGEDPLRALRVARLRATHELEPDTELRALCARLDLAALPGERQLGEWRRLLLEARRPSRGLRFLRRASLLRFFPELAALVGVPQDPEWHPEGSVWVHTLRVVDVAAASRVGDPLEDELLLWGALCHDFGKPATTRAEDGRVRSPRHDAVGVPLAEAFLARLRAPNRTVRGVAALVRHHLAPALYVRGDARARAYRRLARRCQAAGVSLELLHRLARADHLGRTTPEARAGRFPAGDVFLARARALAVEERAPGDAVQGRHLLARGIAPGPRMGTLLRRCRAVQDETGWTDPDRILERVLAESDARG